MTPRRGDIIVSIDRLVLTGLSLDGAQAAQLEHVIQRELAELLTRDRPPLERRGDAVAALHAPPIAIGPTSTSIDVGRRIAWSIHRSLGEGR